MGSIEDLCDACEDGDEEQVKALIESGEVDVNGLHDDSSPLMSAIVWNKPNIVKILLEFANTDLNVVDSKGFNCLHWSCYHDREELVKVIVSDSRCNAEVLNLKSAGGDSPVMVCAWRASAGALSEIMKAEGCDLKTTDAKGMTLLEVAREKSDTEEVIKILENIE